MSKRAAKTPKPPKAEAPQQPKKRAQLTVYTPELADEICARIAACEQLEKICQEERMPNRRTVMRWQRDNEEFRLNLALARQERADARAEKIDALIARVESRDLDPHSAKVAIDAHRWQASKENPGRYGDKVELGGKDGGPIQIEHAGLTDLEAARRMVLLLFEQVTAQGGSEADAIKLLNGNTVNDEAQS
jgi:hypothetical protein